MTSEHRLKFISGSARSASVAYLFSRNGSIRFQPKEGVDVDAALDAAIEVGAEDVDLGEDGEIEVRYKYLLLFLMFPAVRVTRVNTK